MSNTSQEFINPEGSSPLNQGETGTEGFLPPDINEESLQAEAIEQALQEVLAEVDADLLSLKGEIEKSLIASTKAIASSTVSAHEAGGSNIVGVGIGFPDPDSILSGLSTNPTIGQATLKVSRV